MTTGAYLRTNYRTTGNQLNILALGGGKEYGSAASTSSPNNGVGWAVMNRFWGGFVCNSMSYNAMSNCIVHPLTDIIYSWCGAGFNSGYRIIPVGIIIQRLKSIGASMPYNLAWSMTDSTDSNINVFAVSPSGSVLESSYSAAFILAGFICSTPN